MAELMVDVIDNADTVIGRATINEIYAKNLNHRVIHVMLLDADNNIALQKRLPTAHYAPGKWNSSATGIVLNNETYRQAAQRICKENLGCLPEIKFSGKLAYRDPKGHTKFIGVFAAPHSGPFRIDANEIEQVKFFPREVIEQMAGEGSDVHPELSFVIRS